MVTERAIAEPKFSKVYADLCCCMKGLKVPMAEKRGVTLNFQKLLLNCCKMEFERAVEQVEERQIEDRQRHLEDGLEKTCVEVQQRSLGIVKFIGELFKLKMVSEGIIHDCIVRLLKKSKSLQLKSTSTGHFNPLWSLCVLLCTTGKDLERAKARMDQYFNQMKKMIQERKSSNRIRFMLQDVVDLRESNWIPRHSDPGPQTIKQIRKQTMEENCQATQQDQPGSQDSITVLEGEDDTAGPDAKPSDSVEKGSASIQKQVPQKFTAFSRGGKNEDTELFWSVHCILDELTPQTFEPLMRQVSRMPINSEVRLKGLIDLVYERALSVPKLSANYAQMCRCFAGVKVPKDDNWRETLNFRKLLLNRCQKEFEDDETEKQNEMGNDYEEEARATALRRSLGNVKFIGELFKIKMLTEPIIHDCIIKLFNSSQEECLCVLLLTVGKEIDFEEAKPRMEQYFNQMKKIIQEKKTSVNTQCMLQGVVDLRERHWVPKHTDLSLDNIIDQICQEKVPQKFTAFSRGGKNEDTELFWSVHCILDELTPQTFEPLMRQVSRMPINSEVRLKGLIDLVYERALSVPKLSANYAQMCRCFAGVKVPKDDNWRETLNFRKLLLNRCQKEFEDDETEKQNEMGNDYEEEARATALRRSLGNVKFIGELFKIKMLTEPIIHDCIIKLFNSSQEECLCVLLLTVGKEIDFEEAKPRMEQYFDQMKKIIQEKKTSVNTQCMLQGVVDLRERHWVPKHTDLSLDNIIDQICQEKKKSATDSPQSMPDMELPADREERHENTEELHTITEELPTNTEADAEEEELQENTEALPKNTEALPKNTEALPKNIEALQENPEELQENTDQLHKNTERLPKNGEGLPKIREDNTQKLPKNTEELPKNAEDDKEELPKNTEEGDTDKLPKNTWAGNG
ncbi:uncharacterized protein LOC143124025 isoform X2 [Alosa pseudoharengus]|uniref:uncharacterized protein LOC143124025 isoform X2 n=1 Tax=Alosa pseudoharengus TaxID=34774 RepID=UPI003F88D506